MSSYKRAKLPPTFQWQERALETVLRCQDKEVLRVVPLNRGWLVEVLVLDSAGNRPTFIPTSKEAGTWWGARWAKDRIEHLESITRLAVQ